MFSHLADGTGFLTVLLNFRFPRSRAPCKWWPLPELQTCPSRFSEQGLVRAPHSPRTIRTAECGIRGVLCDLVAASPFTFQ